MIKYEIGKAFAKKKKKKKMRFSKEVVLVNKFGDIFDLRDLRVSKIT